MSFNIKQHIDTRVIFRCNVINVANLTLCQATNVMKCLPLILFHVFTRLSTSLLHQSYIMSRTLYSPLQLCISPQTSIWSRLRLCATFLDTPFGMAVRFLPHNDSVVYLHKGKCHIAQHQTEGFLELTQQGEMDKTGQGGREAGNSYYSFGNWAWPNQHIDNIWKFDTKWLDIQPLGAVLDTGAQRGATSFPAEILRRTGTTHHSENAASRGNSKENDRHAHGCWNNRSVRLFLDLRPTRCVCAQPRHVWEPNFGWSPNKGGLQREC